DIIYYWIPDKVDIVLRPWVKAKYENRYPVEFRVFVQDGEILGVSNYYPQMNLSEEYTQYAEESIEITKKLLGTTPSFTADYILTENYELLYLEGGPPHLMCGGAHMCCFKPGEISGVALTNRREHP
ncbi:MAG: cell division cycle 123 family protein, partial [Porphyromonadaceae bacterium]|nr:cell division cycle 123 family protein [Porphyromonadaceae bacterium]